MIAALLWVAAAVAGPPPSDLGPLPRYLDEAAVIAALEAGFPTLAGCFPAESPSVAIPVELSVAGDGTVRRVRVPGVHSPCLEAALSGLRFRPHDEPLDTWTTTVAWVDGALQPWPVASRVRPPRGPLLVRIPPEARAAVAGVLGVDPFAAADPTVPADSGPATGDPH